MASGLPRGQRQALNFGYAALAVVIRASAHQVVSGGAVAKSYVPARGVALQQLASGFPPDAEMCALKATVHYQEITFIQSKKILANCCTVA
jgi:hypothetical protein